MNTPKLTRPANPTQAGRLTQRAAVLYRLLQRDAAEYTPAAAAEITRRLIDLGEYMSAHSAHERRHQSQENGKP